MSDYWTAAVIRAAWHPFGWQCKYNLLSIIMIHNDTRVISSFKIFYLLNSNLTTTWYTDQV